jgi:hypothetical protein
LTTDVLAKLWFRASLLVRRNAGLFVSKYPPAEREIQRVAENGPRWRDVNTFTRLHSRFPHQASMPSRQRAVIWNIAAGLGLFKLD